MLNHARDISPNWFHAKSIQISKSATKVEPLASRAVYRRGYGAIAIRPATNE
jgi:hypothetical protein